MNSSFNKNLIEARKLRELTQKEVANSLKVAEYTYANWEQGRAEPSISDLQKLCEILDISANELLNIEDGSTIKITNYFNGNIENINFTNNKNKNK